ncbi:hypothetical protein [Bradyrhizobium diversitatis]|uniref:Uncharacterized protein n=1 Tax=Bradyrhizobium diversitatis TaxID=2755406 RepID=A0ABS0P5F9_9BRAD|nr:hypothetical protein [Bradyrhizobium diversitatis]MBH5388534.1 hypothetical protein [Bradyrhizobium diversitatis]
MRHHADDQHDAAAHRHADHHHGGIITVIIILSTRSQHQHRDGPPALLAVQRLLAPENDQKSIAITAGEIFAALMFGFRAGR